MLKTMLKSQAGVAVAGLVALEALFAAMARLGDLKLHVVEVIALALAAGAVYCVALYGLEHTAESRAALWLVLAGALLFRLTLAPLPPTLSTDLYRYRWDGRVQNAGWNPYVIAPLDPRLTALRDANWAGMPGMELPAIYPPLAELIFRWTARISTSPAGFKAPFLLADLLIVAMLAGWLRSSGGRNYQLAVYAWSPLVIVEFAGSGHSDALAIAFLVAALMIIRRRPAVSTLAMTAGALTKLFPVTLLPLAVRLAGWPRRLRGWLAAAAAVALAAACAWPYRSAAGQLPQTFSYYRRVWQNYNPSLYGVLLWLTGRPAIAAGIGEAVVVILALWVAARKIEPVRATFLVVGAILMFAPNGYSWYFTWIVPLLCFFPSPAWLLLTVLQFLSYNVLIAYQVTGVFRFNPFFQWLTYAPFCALLLAEMIAKRRPHVVS
jgi:alpha-1,6-mannosyltransferase